MHPQHPPRRSRKPLGAGAIVAIVGVALALLCSAGAVVAIATAMEPADPGWRVPAASDSPRPANTSATQLQGFMVVLEVSGTKTADVSWNINGTGGQRLGVTLPWTETFGPFDGFVIVSMLAQSKDNTTSAAVRGKVTVDGKAIGCTGQGPYSVATCTQNS